MLKKLCIVILILSYMPLIKGSPPHSRMFVPPQYINKTSIELIISNFAIYKELSFDCLRTISKNAAVAIPWYAQYYPDLMKETIRIGCQILLQIDQKLTSYKEVKKFLLAHKEFIGILVGTSTDQAVDYSEIIDFAKEQKLLVIFAYPSLYNHDNYTTVTNYLHKNEMNESIVDIFFNLYSFKAEEYSFEKIYCIDLCPGVLMRINKWLQELIDKNVPINPLRVGNPCQAL